MTKKEAGVTLGRLIAAAHNDEDTATGENAQIARARERAVAYRIVVNSLALPEKAVTEGYQQAYVGDRPGWQERRR